MVPYFNFFYRNSRDTEEKHFELYELFFSAFQRLCVEFFMIFRTLSEFEGGVAKSEKPFMENQEKILVVGARQLSRMNFTPC